MWLSPKVIKQIEDIKQTLKEIALVVPEHDDYGHKYRHVPTDQVFVSVTTKTGILGSNRLQKWASRLAVEYIDRNWELISQSGEKEKHFQAATLAHEDTLKDAGDIGTQGHEVVERYLIQWIETGERPPDIRRFIIGEDARLWAIARSAEQFCTDFEVIPLASELKVCSVKHKFAGTLDSLMMVKKGDKYVFAICDWKSSNSISDKPQYVMQVSAYYQALYEMTGLKPKELLIIRLDKEKMKYEVIKIVHRSSAFKAFKQLCNVYDYINSGVSLTYPFVPKKDVFIN